MDSNRVCNICDGGPGNECACTCPGGPTYGTHAVAPQPEIYYREENARWPDDLLAISCIEFRVVRRTPCGRWITPTWNGDDNTFLHFVLDGDGKRYAYPTREKARASFIIRKQREIQKCAAQHDRAQRYLKLAQTMQFGTRTEALHEIKPAELLTFENHCLPQALR